MQWPGSEQRPAGSLSLLWVHCLIRKGMGPSWLLHLSGLSGHPQVWNCGECTLRSKAVGRCRLGSGSRGLNPRVLTNAEPGQTVHLLQRLKWTSSLHQPPQSSLWSGLKDRMLVIYWIGQNVHSDFSLTACRKIQTFGPAQYLPSDWYKYYNFMVQLYIQQEVFSLPQPSLGRTSPALYLSASLSVVNAA